MNNYENTSTTNMVNVHYYYLCVYNMSLEGVMEANHNRKKFNGHLGVVDISADGEGGVSK